MATPYASYVADRDPVEVLATSLSAYGAAIGRLTAGDWERPWAPGKWSIREVMVHVAQWEMIMGVRFRFGLSVDDYVVQTADQDPFMHEAASVDGPTAFSAFGAMRRMNLAMARALGPDQLARRFTHPERGQIDVRDVLVTLAGHAEHHLHQIMSARA